MFHYWMLWLVQAQPSRLPNHNEGFVDLYKADRIWLEHKLNGGSNDGRNDRLVDAASAAD